MKHWTDSTASRPDGAMSCVLVGAMILAGCSYTEQDGASLTGTMDSEPLADSSPVAANDYGGLPSMMHQKMFHSQRLLAGMTMENFPLVQDAAQELIWLSKLAEWKVVDTPEYEHFSMAFRGTAEDIVAASAQRNMPAVEDAYARLTRACLDCHGYLREQGIHGMPGATTWKSDEASIELHAGLTSRVQNGAAFPWRATRRCADSTS
ncbi:MAG: hypothetical protein KC983_07805 [Phycisphaerales bacterium]|nr:hypothetical protein [Phycisphaerales bacterium]